MSATTQLMTAEELLGLPPGRFRYELVKGELVTTSPAGEEHGAIVVNLTLPLAQHVKARKLGTVYGAETGFQIASDPDTVLAPDIAFVRRERILQTGLSKGYRIGAPDLAVEVVSPGESRKRVETKVQDWLSGGARAVWVVDPKTRTVKVYHGPSASAVLKETDELTGGDLVPGFRCSVAEIFV